MTVYPPPTLGGYITFLRNNVGIGAAYLPDASTFITDSFNWAIEVVNLAIAAASSLAYSNAVYNLATDVLISTAVDQPGKTFFFDLQAKWKTNDFVAGIVQSANDEGTGETMVVSKAFENLTLADLQNLKTPYGRAYLAIAQRYGTLWGIT